jgi:hypothetical protein
MISVRVSSSLLGATPAHEIVRLDTAVSNCTWSTSIFGGFNTATITLIANYRHQIPVGAHIEIFWDGELVFEGMRRRPTLLGRDVRSLDVVGYATALGDASVFRAKAFVGEQIYTANVCLAQAMAMQPLLSVGPVWGAPAVQHALSVFNGQNLWQIAQRLYNETGYDWAVWEQRRASFTQRVAPALADYLIAEDDITSWQEDDSNIWTRVSAAYTDITSGQATETEMYVNKAAEAAGSPPREIQLSVGTTDAAGAETQAQTYLAQHANPAVSTYVGPYPMLKRPSGYTPGQYVRAGQWCELQNRNFGQDTGTVSGGLMLPIVLTQHDSMGNCTATLGSLSFDLVGRLRTLESVSVAVKAGLNPVSGAAA